MFSNNLSITSPKAPPVKPVSISPHILSPLSIARNMVVNPPEKNALFESCLCLFFSIIHSKIANIPPKTANPLAVPFILLKSTATALEVALPKRLVVSISLNLIN